MPPVAGDRPGLGHLGFWQESSRSGEEGAVAGAGMMRMAATRPAPDQGSVRRLLLLMRLVMMSLSPPAPLTRSTLPSTIFWSAALA